MLRPDEYLTNTRSFMAALDDDYLKGPAMTTSIWKLIRDGPCLGATLELAV